MKDPANQTVRHRRVSAELKRMRDEAEMSVYDVADAMGWNRTKVHRLERGEWKRLKESDVRALATLYRATETRRVDALVAMAKQASTKGWWARYSDVLGPGSYVSLEAGASSLRFYSALLIPGLFQTHSYAEAIFRAGGIDNEEEIERRLEARTARREILTRKNPIQTEVVLDQAALNKVVGRPSAMAEQLLSLIETGKRGEAEIRVVPDDTGAHAAMTGQFVILDFPSEAEEPVVHIDSAHSGLFMEEPEEIEAYTLIYDRVRSSALSTNDSYDLMAALVDRLVSERRNDD